MAGETTSPNMNLVIPAVGVTAGPLYASDLNASLIIIDAHDHTPGNGVQITPTAMNINADLSFAGFNATNLRTARFGITDPTIIGTDLYCLHKQGVDLYYVDGNGNNIQITSAGNVAGTSGSIANLTSPASATYIAVSTTFVWQSAANVAATLDCRNLILRKSSASSAGLTIQPFSSLAVDTTFTLPALPAANNSFVTMDTSGAMGTAFTYDSSTITVSSNTLKVAPAGITPTQLNTSVAGAGLTGGAGAALSLSTGGIVTANIADHAVTQIKLQTRTTGTGAGGISKSSPITLASLGSGTFADITGLSVTLTTTGRPVMVMCMGNSGGSPSYFRASAGAGNLTSEIGLKILQGASEVFQTNIGQAVVAVNTSTDYPASCVAILDTPAAGTYTWKVQYKTVGTNAIFDVFAVTLAAWEI